MKETLAGASKWEDFDFDTMGPQFYGEKRR